MALTLVSTPFKGIGEGLSGTWLAANNPIYFVYEYTGGSLPTGYAVNAVITHNSVAIFSGIYYPDTTGKIYVGDLSEVLRSVLLLETTFDYASINDTEPNISAGFNIEFWGGAAGAREEQPSTKEYDFYAMHAANQIGYEYGCAMIEYELESLAEPSYKKFLTLFEKPRYFVGYPFCIDFIYSGNTYPQRSEWQTKFDESLTSKVYDNLGTYAYYGDAVNHLKIKENYNSDEKETNIYLRQSGGAQDELTETKVITIDRKICENPFYVRWINHIGGVEQWLFKVNQKRKTKVTDLQTINKYIQDVSTARGTQSTINLNEAEAYLIGADNLSLNEWEVISQQLGGSLTCYVYKNSQWLECIVEPADYETNTDQPSHSIQLSIIMPQIQTQRK